MELLNIPRTWSCRNPILQYTLGDQFQRPARWCGLWVYKIRAIFECRPLLARSQKRCVKGPQRWLEAFQYKADQQWWGNLGPCLWARSPVGSFGGLATPPLTRTMGLPGCAGPAMQWACLRASQQPPWHPNCSSDFLSQLTDPRHTQIQIAFNCLAQPVSGLYSWIWLKKRADVRYVSDQEWEKDEEAN